MNACVVNGVPLPSQSMQRAAPTGDAGWPGLPDYHDAIQSPASCFSDPELKSGRVVSGSDQLPQLASGNFASVYQVHNGTKSCAVRCFFRRVSGREERYAALRRHLTSISVPALVAFEYLTQGIRVRGAWYPILKMEWVHGETLERFVEQNLQKPAVLLSVADNWRKVVAELRRAALVHGDFQHGNIYVLPDGSIRLIDYDGMFVRGMPFPAAETGHANYQHPERQRRHAHEGLDDFSALVIDTSLRVLSVDPQLWPEFHTGENLIFSRPPILESPANRPFFYGSFRIKIPRLCKPCSFSGRRVSEKSSPCRGSLRAPLRAPTLEGSPFGRARPWHSPSPLQALRCPARPWSIGGSTIRFVQQRPSFRQGRPLLPRNRSEERAWGHSSNGAPVYFRPHEPFPSTCEALRATSAHGPVLCYRVDRAMGRALSMTATKEPPWTSRTYQKTQENLEKPGRGSSRLPTSQNSSRRSSRLMARRIRKSF